jgi:serine/threonine protein kinase
MKSPSPKKKKELGRKLIGGGLGSNYFISDPLNSYPCMATIDIREVIHDRFEVQHVLWRGKGSLVCQALDREEKVVRALKVHREERSRELRREWLLSQMLFEHPNLIAHHSLHETPGIDGQMLTLLSMDLAGSGSLRNMVTSQSSYVPHQLSERISIFRQICAGVGCLHRAGVLHLDIKSDNMLGHNNHWMVSDFGLSYHPDMDGKIEPKDPRKGTPTYMSPEQFEAVHPAELSERADIYSLGILLYELLAPLSMPPFVGGYNYLREKHAKGEIPSLESWTVAQKDWFHTCLSKRSAGRFDSIDALLKELDKAFPELSNIQTDPNHDQGAYSQAKALLLEVERELPHGDLEELATLLEEADRLSPNMPEIRPLLIKAQYRSQQFEAAMEALQGDIEEGDLESALLHAKSALVVNPKSLTAQQLVQRLERQLNQSHAWREAMEQAVWGGDEEKAIFFAKKLDDLRLSP